MIKEVRKVMPQLTAQLPPNLKVAIAYDATRFIQASIDEVVQTLIEAVLIVIVVVFLFLGAFRSVPSQASTRSSAAHSSSPRPSSPSRTAPTTRRRAWAS